MFSIISATGSSRVGANHSKGNTSRCNLFPATVPVPLWTVVCVGVGARSLLTSRPKSRAELVNALGRPVLGFASELFEGYTRVGAGDISIGTGDSWGNWRQSRGGEFNDMVDANDSSKSEDRNSSTSSCARAAGWWLALLKENWGTLRNRADEDEVFAKSDGMAVNAERSWGFLFCFLEGR